MASNCRPCSCPCVWCAEDEDDTRAGASGTAASAKDAARGSGSKRWRGVSDSDILRDLDTELGAAGDGPSSSGAVAVAGAGGPARKKKKLPGRRVWWPDQEEDGPAGGFVIKTSKKVRPWWQQQQQQMSRCQPQTPAPAAALGTCACACRCKCCALPCAPRALTVGLSDYKP